ncbi:unnamed protein product [Vicia faba]|uniref:Uncharacterized protein n=1 Tax=Vicia faba TaxID=3906 RepID=A0AAV1AZ42_VICFA|nr:unnamed protein product [Vicia faba]
MTDLSPTADNLDQSSTAVDITGKIMAQTPCSTGTILAAPEPSSSSSAAFPTNVLIWGNHHQTISSTTSEQNTCSSSSSDGMLRIDIPNETEATTSSSSPSPSPSSPSATGGRLRSLKRLLSNTRLNPWSPTAAAASASLQQQTKPKESPAGHS